MKVYKVEMMVVDFDNIGEEEIKFVLENNHYPNHCIDPDVMNIEGVEVEWSDQHPLNIYETQEAEYNRLFPRKI